MKSRVLIVEDEFIVARSLSATLADCDYEVVGIADSGEDAIAMAEAKAPNIILMDIRLRGEMKGFEAARIIYERFKIPVVFLTAHSDPATVKEVMSSKAFGCILKPYQDRELHVSLEMALQRHQLEKQLLLREDQLRKNERRLNEQRAELEATINATPTGLMLLDRDLVIKTINHSLADWLGFDAHRLIGRHWFDVRPDLKERESVYRKVLEGTPMAFSEVTLDFPSGVERYFDLHYRPVFAGQREVIGFLVATIDVTEKRRLNLQRQLIDSKLHENQRLESLAVLAGGIAHDFNSLLVGMLGYADIALRQISRESQAHRWLGEIKSGARKAADLCNKMLAYSGKGQFLVEDLELTELIDKTLERVALSIPQNIKIRKELSVVGKVSGDASQISQVIVNLIFNAIESYQEKSGEITVRVFDKDCSPSYLETLPFSESSAPGPYVSCQVIDRGCGMNEETLSRVFEPFFTTKFTGRGLGLAAVQGIVRGHKGLIFATSDLAKGSTFEVLLPTAKTLDIESALESGEFWLGKGAVLLVHKDQTLCKIAELMLKELGFTVLLADSLKETVKHLRARGGDIRGVFVDMVSLSDEMKALCHEIQRLAPQLPIVVASSYGEATLARQLGKKPKAVLMKPFEIKALKKVMLQALQEP
ncbi:MAG: response regulator [Planctomycetota bacterium]|nr:response regulator [Planctomycetota bacterium]